MTPTEQRIQEISKALHSAFHSAIPPSVQTVADVITIGLGLEAITRREQERQQQAATSRAFLCEIARAPDHTPDERLMEIIRQEREQLSRFVQETGKENQQQVALLEECANVLKQAYEAMGYLGDILNEHNMIEPIDELKVNPTFDTVRAFLKRLKEAGISAEG
jgi:hypothetical protein